MGPVPALLSLIAAAQAGTLLVLEQGDPWDGRFYDELSLAMDGVTLQAAPAAFGAASASAQLDAVRPMLGAEVDAAVAWLDTGDPDLLRVSIAFIEADRAVIRLFDYPRDEEALAEMALATRAFLTETYREAPPLPPPPPPPPWQVEIACLSVLPASSAGGGARLGGEAIVEHTWGELALGGGFISQANGAQWRVGPRAQARYGPVWLGVQIDRAVIDWTTQVQPRLAAGLRLQRRELTVGPRLLVAPRRDEVVQADEVLYDSGWVEVGISLGWVRKISLPPSHSGQ